MPFTASSINPAVWLFSHELGGEWRYVLTSAVGGDDSRAWRRHDTTGRPLGDDEFLVGLEKNLGRN